LKTPAAVADLIASYQLPDKLTFGTELAPVMYQAEFRDGEWQPGSLVPFADVPVNPAATALQFGQQAFEGMKAYRGAGSAPVLFRPDMNWRRFARSAERLLMPPVPATLFAEALSSLAVSLADFIPGGRGQSLYLRPTMFGLDPHFAVKGSDRFLFIVIASPSDAYFANPIRILIERDNCRAASGGTGAVKVGGNYAASLLANQQCIARGFDQSLWLDPKERKNIEELSAMNFIAVIDGALHSPAPSGSLLEGVTRDSLLQLAEHRGIRAQSVTMPIDDLLRDIEDGRCTEAFACGTGAIVVPIKAIGDADGREWALPEVGKMSSMLRDALLDIQGGKAEDPFGWVVDAGDSNLDAYLAR
jgi:branched-chain amino acid aminotransferase